MVEEYVAICASAFSSQDAETLASYLTLTSSAATIATSSSSRRASHITQTTRSVLSSLPLPSALTDALTTLVSGTLLAAAAPDDVEAYKALAEGYKGLVRYVRDASRWFVPVVEALARQLRVAAGRADAALVARGDDARYLGEAAAPLRQTFSACLADRAGLKASRKWAVLTLVNQLFYAYFALNKLQNCKQLIQTLRAKTAALPLEKFPVSQQVIYGYFVGRLQLFDGEYDKAAETLTAAFHMCHPQAVRNKTRILVFLIPVNLLRGTAPTPDLLDTYNLPEFADLSAAVVAGDVATFNAALSAHQSFYIAKGVYLMLEQLRVVTYRNLFRKVYLIHGSHKVPIGLFTTALVSLGEEVDNVEVECLLANLIFKGYMKGYLSHEHACLVLGKSNAFPPLGSR